MDSPMQFPDESTPNQNDPIKIISWDANSPRIGFENITDGNLGDYFPSSTNDDESSNTPADDDEDEDNDDEEEVYSPRNNMDDDSDDEGNYQEPYGDDETSPNLDTYFATMMMKPSNVDDESRQGFDESDALDYGEEDVEDGISPGVDSPRFLRQASHIVNSKDVIDEVGDQIIYESAEKLQLVGSQKWDDDQVQVGTLSEYEDEDDDEHGDANEVDENIEGFAHYVMTLAGEMENTSPELLDSLAGTLGELPNLFDRHGSFYKDDDAGSGHHVSAELLGLMMDYEAMMDAVSGKKGGKSKAAARRNRSGTEAEESDDGERKPIRGKAEPKKPVKQPRKGSVGRKGVPGQGPEEKKGVKKVIVPSGPPPPNFDADERNKALIHEMEERRRREEEESARAEAERQRRREKFKQVEQGLLEKAQQSRVTAGFAAPTKAFEVQKFVKPSSSQEPDPSSEEGKALLVARRDMVAAIRRRFKERYKQILASLTQKNKEEEEKADQQELIEREKREKRRRRLEQLLMKRAVQLGGDGAHPMPEKSLSARERTDHGNAAETEALRRDSVRRATSTVKKDAQAKERVRESSLERAAKPVGSGLKAARKLSDRPNQSNGNGSGAESAEEEGPPAAVAKKKPGKGPNAATRVTEHLTMLAEQKRLQEEETKRKQEKAKRQKALLTNRVLAEANERKLMAAEDKYSNPEDLDGRGLKTEAGGAAAKKKRDSTQLKVSAEAAEVIYNRLASKAAAKGQDGEAVSVPARDFADWKKKNGVPSDAPVFTMTGWYPCVKEALLARGWYLNPDPQSPHADMKWTLKSADLDREALQPWQLTNHFTKNVAITTKVGLLHSLDGVSWLADVAKDDVIPRGYDLNNTQETQAFIDDFRCQKAEIIMKRLYFQATGFRVPPVSTKRKLDEVDNGPGKSEPMKAGTASMGWGKEVDGLKKEREGARKLEPVNDDDLDDDKKRKSLTDATLSPSTDAESVADAGEGDLYTGEEVAVDIPPCPPAIVNPESIKINEAVFQCAVAVIERWLSTVDNQEELEEDAVTNRTEEEQGAVDSQPLVSPLEWEVLLTGDLDRPCVLPAEPPFPAVDSFLQAKEADNKSSAVQHRLKRLKEQNDRRSRNTVAEAIGRMRPLGQAGLQKVHELICRLYRVSPYQFGLNGYGNDAKNLWIVKPSAKSRGRGIMTFKDLNKLLKYCDAGIMGRSTGALWIVQKYMENPLIIARRKFDLRQWVLVTDWNPLTVYFYSECYARFSVEEYDTSDSSLENAFVHLVNNSIGKNSENFARLVESEDGRPIEGYMWSYESFEKHLRHLTGGDAALNGIAQRMRDIAKWSLMCGAEAIEHRKNSWELYGFDFMVDDNFNAWLIEINSSPACDYSTKVTERYVQAALVDLLKVVLDVRSWDKEKSRGGGNAAPRPETGGWELIYKGPVIDTPVASFGMEMAVKGEAMSTRGARKINGPAVGSNAPSLGLRASQEKEKRGTANVNTSNDADSDTASVTGSANGRVLKPAVVSIGGPAAANPPANKPATVRPTIGAAAQKATASVSIGKAGDRKPSPAKTALATRKAKLTPREAQGEGEEDGRDGDGEGGGFNDSDDGLDDSTDEQRVDPPSRNQPAAIAAAGGPARKASTSATSAGTPHPPPQTKAIPMKTFTVDF